ncbi:hypothetical protein PR202_ga03450 [Eleusine coracana subsp. coracana]|uniref:Uncharacterized protein n=1 Tax=Eleusine coracana subsp. coracana TaxID=191504 RepID=A0AAV5BP16_ELECO|nr:hypothetical protein PR202_ga03450 [Eleusine coracana subsp. coracana]
MLHFPSSSLGLRAIREEAWNDFSGQELPPTKSPSQEVSDGDANKTLTRAVPQGPNPLHNR